MTPLTLSQACGISFLRAQTWAPCISTAIDRFEIQALAMFTAQIAHESGLFLYTREIWGPTEAQKGYASRVDLGNTKPEAQAYAAAAGDEPGHFYRGAGLLQLTGYRNILAFSLAWWGDDRGVKSPSLLAVPANAAASAAWYWVTHRLDPLAASGTPDAFVAVTRVINGGTNGLENRLRLWEMAKRAGLR